MRASALVLCVLIAACSSGPLPEFVCEEAYDCNLRPGGLCFMSSRMEPTCAYPEPACGSGYAWDDMGGPLTGVCTDADAPPVTERPDAMPAPDAPDASVIDAPEPPMPIVDNGQAADLVLGQRDFSGNLENANGGDIPSAQSLAYPRGLFADGTSLWVPDMINNRVLQWSPLPDTSFAAAGRVLGRQNFVDYGFNNPAQATGSLLGGPEAIASVGGKLLVVDSTWHRVLIWSSPPVTNGQSADLVLGFPNLTTGSHGPGTIEWNGAKMRFPRAIWTDGNRIVVTDTGNHRVLIWTQFPVANATAATVVLGQPNFQSTAQPTEPTATNLRMPEGVWSDGTRLFIADTLFNRILVWNTFPTRNGQPADYVIGQPDLVSAQRGIGTQRMNRPTEIIGVDDALFVTDSENHRVLVFQPIPTGSNGIAARVLGQATFDVADEVVPPSGATLIDPAGLAVAGDKLFVSDGGNHRVLRFHLRRTP